MCRRPICSNVDDFHTVGTPVVGKMAADSSFVEADSSPAAGSNLAAVDSTGLKPHSVHTAVWPPTCKKYKRNMSIQSRQKIKIKEHTELTRYILCTQTQTEQTKKLTEMLGRSFWVD